MKSWQRPSESRAASFTGAIFKFPADKLTLIVLTNSQTAALLKTVMTQIASGTLDKSLFTPAFQAALTPAAITPAHDMLTALDPLTSLTLLRRSSDGSALYKAMYGATAVNWLIVVDKDHKIAALRPLPQ